MSVYTTHQAKTHLSRLIDEVEAGGEVVISRGKRPVVRLISHTEGKTLSRPSVGQATSKPIKLVEKRETEGKTGDSIVYF